MRLRVAAFGVLTSRASRFSFNFFLGFFFETGLFGVFMGVRLRVADGDVMGGVRWVNGCEAGESGMKDRELVGNRPPYAHLAPV